MFPFIDKIHTLFIITGESNSGGQALISQADPAKTGVRSSVNIINNTTFLYETLNIGVNNLIGHSGLTGGTTYGFEMEIANRAAVNSFYMNPSYIVKTGHGGSTISQWNVGGGYMNAFIARVNAAKALMPSPNYRVVILYSQGINDKLNSTPVATWKAATITHFANLRAAIGRSDVPIIMTEFQGMGTGGNQYADYITAMREIDVLDPYTVSVDMTGATLNGDNNHWNGIDSGINLVAGKLLDVVERWW
jgi:hypothetical protein